MTGTVHVRVTYEYDAAAIVWLPVVLLDGSHRRFAVQKTTTVAELAAVVGESVGLPPDRLHLFTLYLVSAGREDPLAPGQSPLRMVAQRSAQVAEEHGQATRMSWFEYVTGYGAQRTVRDFVSGKDIKPVNRDVPSGRGRDGKMGAATAARSQGEREERDVVGTQLTVRIFFQQRFFYPEEPLLDRSNPGLVHLMFLQACRVVSRSRGMRLSPKLVMRLAALQMRAIGLQPFEIKNRSWARKVLDIFGPGQAETQASLVSSNSPSSVNASDNDESRPNIAQQESDDGSDADEMDGLLHRASGAGARDELDSGSRHASDAVVVTVASPSGIKRRRMGSVHLKNFKSRSGFVSLEVITNMLVPPPIFNMRTKLGWQVAIMA